MSQRPLPTQPDTANAAPVGLTDRARAIVSERPTLALTSILVILSLVTGLVEPNFLSVSGARNTLLQAAPLGILAGAQTILMLTGGIDLSVTMIATGSAYVAANQSPNGAAIAILLGVVVGLLVGSANGVGVSVFRVNPLIMTLAMSGILLGLFTAWAQTILQGSTQVAPFIKVVGAGSFLGHRFPFSVVVWALVAGGLIWLLRRTGWGRLLYAIGDNEVAVRLAGSDHGLHCGRGAQFHQRHTARRSHRRGRSPACQRLSPAIGGGCGDRRHLDFWRRERICGHDPRRADPERSQLDAHIPQRWAGYPAGRIRGNRAGAGVGLCRSHPPGVELQCSVMSFQFLANPFARGSY